MELRKFIPSFLRTLRIRTKWFIKNYNSIFYNSLLFTPEQLQGNVTFFADGLITSNNCDFINEEKFAKAYQHAKATNPWPNFTLQWRVYVVCWFASLAKNLEGDFVECGVNTGAYARAIVDYLNFEELDKKFYLFDTYEGLVESMVSEEEKNAGIASYIGQYDNVYERVLKTFAPFKNVEIIKGIVPHSLSKVETGTICYLSIDMNCAEPEIAAARFYWDKIVRGGVVILDDYGFPKHIEQKKAFDKFAKEKDVQILSLPTGQGIIIKK
ncbi:MAG: class I SAM-dependent methyltransferase [Sporocytophaga sp.]|uniref:TylF/MycF/NovP-related O-methyltransferase n=1 Tax=Sporocytophaga sp. TaxID=2231183 RepID=UPI001B2678E6|nr:TylF/MycF/NovP-related O-methyltransferase [Sporocytophaga sp.]MBO9701641.1 class I SAM-dependent methyltransferase [Sporocytophaga sp.]